MDFADIRTAERTVMNITLLAKNDNQTTLDRYEQTINSTIPYNISVAGALLAILIIAAGTFGNVLVILSVFLTKPLYKVANIFVVSLAIWDLCQNMLVKPLYVHTYIQRQWEFGPRVCLYALFASNLAILESILHVSAIALHRYIILVHPNCAPRFQSCRTILLMLASIYALPVLIVLMPSIKRLMNPGEMGQQLVFNNRIMFCSFVRHSEFRLSGVLKKVMFLSIAACFLLYCYIRIYLVVRKSGQSVNNTSGTFSPTRLSREWTLLKTIMVIFITFLFSYLPLSILYGIDTDRDFPYWVYFVGVMLLWTSSSINWLIYGLMNKQYMRAYKYILCGTTFPGLSGPTTCRENGSVSKSSFSMSVRNGNHRTSYNACSGVCRLPSFDGDI